MTNSGLRGAEDVVEHAHNVIRHASASALIRDILDSLAAHGFRRIVMVNGHGGNAPVQALIDEWLDSHAGVAVKFHNWWKAPATWKKVMEIDAVASHASWMENFPFTRLDDVQYPEAQKPMLDVSHIRNLSPVEARRYLGDGNFGGRYQRSDQDMLAVWRAGVEETRKVIAEDWS